MGPKIEAHLERPGFYPAGGGKVTVVVDPGRARPDPQRQVVSIGN